MATLQELESALRKAHAAGNADHARIFAAEIRKQRQAKPADFSGVTATVETTGNKPRAGGLAGRAIAQGTAGVLDMFSDGMNTLPSMGLLKMGMDSLPSVRDATQAFLTSRGVAKPQTAGERVAVGVGEAATGTALSLGAGAAGNLRFLKAHPVQQAVGTLTGATAAEVAREKGASPIVQGLLGFAGGMAPSAVVTGAQGATRVAMRGGEQGRQNVANTIADFHAAGTTPTVGQATQNRVIQAAESTLGRLPGGAGVIARRAEQQGEQIGQGVRQTADQLSPRADAESAGRAIERGINQPGGFMDRTGQVQERLYGALDQHIAPTTRVGVDSTARVLPEINPVIPGAPALSRQFQNGRIQGIEEGFTRDTAGVDAVMSRPDVRAWADELRFALQSEADDIARRNAERQSLGLRPDPVPTPEAIEAQVMGRVAAMADGRLPYEAVQKTRTLVGKEIADAGIGSDVPRSKWNPLYGALSDDMRGAAADAGPEAMAAWSRANKYTRAKAERQDSIAHVVDKSGGPEAIFKAATSGTQEGATTLRALMRSLPEGSQRQVAAAVLNRMGRATNSNQNMDGSTFSTGTFLTNWNKLSPQARAALFDRFGPEFRARVDAITRTADNLKSGSKIYANPSGTAAAQAQNFGWGALGASGVSALFGHPLPLALTAGGMVGNSALARMLTRPQSAAWLAEKTPIPYSMAATLPHILGRSNEDEENAQNQRNRAANERQR